MEINPFMLPDIRALIRKHGLSAIEEGLVQSLQPVIGIRLLAEDQSTNISFGASKIGGTPDLPALVSWPEQGSEPLRFLAQFNLSDVRPYDVDTLLPASGLLSFFMSEDYQAQVIYTADITPLQPTSLPERLRNELALERSPFAMPGQFPARAVAFCQTNTVYALRWWETALAEQTGAAIVPHDKVNDPYFLVPELDGYFALEQVLAKDCSVANHLLGHAQVVQGDMQYQALNDGTFEKWQLLFQLTSEPSLNMIWGDVGTLYFWIKPDDLRAYRFDRVRLEVQGG